MKAKIAVILVTLFSYTIVNAIDKETPRPVNMQSPNASNLGKFGDVPVNMYSGTPDISIPIMELKTKNMNLNITMRYDASGIRVKSHPSWVGQNWSLEAGGVITRSVQGYEDEYPCRSDNYGGYNSGTNQEIHKAGFFYTLGNQKYIDSNMVDLSDFSYKRTFDCQPDIFTFNFMGKTGKFWMGNDGDWKVQSDWNIDVVYHNYSVNDGLSYSGTPSFLNINVCSMYEKHQITLIKGFKLRDDEGNTYLFGFDDTAIEYSIDFFNQYKMTGGPTNYFPSYWRSNAWYLKKVIDKNGNSLFEFTYERGKYIADFYEYKEGTSFCSNYTLNYPVNATIYNTCSSFTEDDQKIKLGGNLISPVYLSQIYNVPNVQYVYFKSSASSERPYTNCEYVDYNGSSVTNIGNTFPFNTITDYTYENNGGTRDDSRYPYLQCIDTTYRDTQFNQDRLTCPILSLRWRKLDAIHLVSANLPNYNHIKSVRFIYNDSQISNTQRLVPTKIDFEFKNYYYNTAAATPEYSYKFKYNAPNEFTNYLSRKYDHWGFYNGSGSFSNDFIPGNPSPSCKKGILTSIIYPTGGSSNFEYDQNYAKYYMDGTEINVYNNYVGGLRIKSIISENGNATDSTRRDYFYSDSTIWNHNVETGILQSKPCYTFQWGIQGSIHGDLTFFRQSIIPIIPLTNVFGSHIGYPTVTERISKNGEVLSKTINKYYSSSEIPDLSVNGSGGPTVRFSDMSFMRGKLKSTLLKKDLKYVELTTYNYRNYGENSFDTSYVKANNYSFITANPAEITKLDANNNPYTALFRASSISGNDYKLYYPRYDVIEIEKRIYSSDGFKVINKTKYNKNDYALYLKKDYPFDERTNLVNFRLTESVEELSSDESIRKTVFTYPFQHQESSMDTLMNQFRLETISKTYYRNNDFIGKEKWTYNSFNGVVQPRAYYRYSNNQQLSVPEITYDKYDSQGNLLSFTEKNGLQNAIIWDIMIQKPSVHVVNMNYDAVKNLIQNEGIEVFARRYTNAYSLREPYLSTLRNQGKNVKVYFYDFSDTGNLLKKINPNGTGMIYEYDIADRLKAVKTLDNKLLETYDYNYRSADYVTNNPYYN